MSRNIAILIAVLIAVWFANNFYFLYRMETLSNRINMMADVNSMLGRNRDSVIRELKARGYDLVLVGGKDNTILIKDPGPYQNLSQRHFMGNVEFDGDIATRCGVTSSFASL